MFSSMHYGLIAKNFKNITLLMLFFLIATPLMSQPAETILSPLGKLKNTEFDESLAYDGFEASSDYLTWFEYYLNNAIIYDIEKEQLTKIELTEGRGPNEFQGIMGLIMDDKGILNILDVTNIKFIRVRPTGEFLKDINPPIGYRPMKMVYGNGHFVVLDAFNSKGIFFLIEEDGYKLIETTNFSLDENFNTPFKKLGYLTINGDTLIHLVQYYPYLYVYDLTSKTLVERIKFDDSDISDDTPYKTPDGGIIHAPPAKVGVLSKAITAVPGTTERVLILAEGKSKKREYKLSQLHEYDLV